MASPFDSVFTTLPWNGAGDVAFRPKHISRLQNHSERLGIDWPDDFEQRLAESVISTEIPENQHGMGLASIRLERDGTVSISYRWAECPPSPLKAVSQQAPRWESQVMGSKHGDWLPYSAAREAALSSGANIALLVHDGAVVDGDRCTPMLLDADGVAHVSVSSGGGIDSVTLAVLLPALEQAGIPLHHSRLTETLLGRAREVIVVGSGCGVAWLSEIDGQPVGTGALGPLHTILSEALDTALENGYSPLVVGVDSE